MTVNKSNQTTVAAGRKGVTSSLKSRVLEAIEAHHQRMVSLRDYEVTRHDWASTAAGASATVAEPDAQPAQQVDGNAWLRPITLIANWFGAVYAAHEARVAALRVYSRERG